MKIKYPKLASASLNFLLVFYFTLHDLISGELTYDAKPGKNVNQLFHVKFKFKKQAI
jgi:hypothetical protein